MPVQAPRRLFTVREFQQMAAAGVLREDDRVELLAGEIVEMTPIGRRHAGCVNYLTRAFSNVLGSTFLLSVQNPVTLGEHSQAQPDVAVLRFRADFYRDAHPGPDEVLLIVEVADTSADADRTDKIPLYARAGIPEVWLVDLPNGLVEVYRQPSPDGYRECGRVRRGDRLTGVAVSGIDLPASDVLS